MKYLRINETKEAKGLCIEIIRTRITVSTGWEVEEGRAWRKVPVFTGFSWVRSRLLCDGSVLRV